MTEEKGIETRVAERDKDGGRVLASPPIRPPLSAGVVKPLKPGDWGDRKPPENG